MAFSELNAPIVAGIWKRSLILTLNLQVSPSSPVIRHPFLRAPLGSSVNTHRPGHSGHSGLAPAGTPSAGCCSWFLTGFTHKVQAAECSAECRWVSPAAGAQPDSLPRTPPPPDLCAINSLLLQDSLLWSHLRNHSEFGFASLQLLHKNNSTCLPEITQPL